MLWILDERRVLPQEADLQDRGTVPARMRGQVACYLLMGLAVFRAHGRVKIPGIVITTGSHRP